MKIAKTIQQIITIVSDARDKAKTVGFVPTMGALHTGHVSLIETAGKQCDFVVVSIFVNPTQFGPTEDYEKYPHTLDDDLDICRSSGVDAVFVPDVEQMYPEQQLSWVNVEKLTEPLCGRSRPGHFRAVATVCAKLFNIVQPNAAFFGCKDAQQAVVIKRMVADLNMPLRIVTCPTVRDSDGLAVSSRNKYLLEDQRRQALLIYKSLQAAGEMIKQQGCRDSQTIIGHMRKILGQGSLVQVEYISIVDAGNLQPVDRVSGRVLIAVAARVGSTRLIDNITVDLSNL